MFAGGLDYVPLFPKGRKAATWPSYRAAGFNKREGTVKETLFTFGALREETPRLFFLVVKKTVSQQARPLSSCTETYGCNLFSSILHQWPRDCTHILFVK